MLDDLRYALRILLKSPGFTGAVLVSLALGIGANATVFCWIQNILLRPFPGVVNQEQMVAVTNLHGTTVGDSLSVPDLKDLAKLNDVFDGVIGSVGNRSDMQADGRSEWIYGQIVTANFFSVLGVKPLLGRTFLPGEDEQPGGRPLMVISETLWKRRFAGEAGIIGRTVDVNRHKITIVGVVPAVFRGTYPGLICDFWAPLSMSGEFGNRGGDAMGNRSERWVQTNARLRDGESLAHAQAALDILGAQLEKAYPGSNQEIRLGLLPIWKSPIGAQPIMRPVLGLLQAISLGLLLIVAVNVANLLLARATLRKKEVAVRMALGAGRGRLIRQLLTESLVLSLIGGSLGTLLAKWMAELAGSFIPYKDLPLGFSVTLHWQTLGMTLLLTLATGVAFGLVPALKTSRPRLNETLKESGRSSTAGAPQHRMLNLFVVSEIAIALVVLVCAGLCLKGLGKARHIDLGFNPEHLLYVGFDVDKNATVEARAALCRDLQQQLATLPGVQRVGLANWYPLGFDPGVGSWAVDVEGYPRQPNEDLEVNCTNVSAGYFAAMQIPLIDGREFTDRDDEKGARVVVINEAMARRFWPRQNPIGRRFSASGVVWTVVGVAKTGKYRSLAESDRCFLYVPYPQWPFSDTVALCIRTAGDPASMADVVRQQIHALSPGSNIWAAMPMSDYIQAAFMAQRITSGLLALLGVGVLALAAMGVYGVMAYVVSQRAHEFGVRLALGARARDILRLVLRRGLGLGLLGILLGLLLAAAITRLLADFLYGVSPFDAAIFVGVPALLILITFLACWLPAVRATRFDPMLALRCD